MSTAKKIAKDVARVQASAAAEIAGLTKRKPNSKRLEDAALRKMRKNLDGRDNNSGAPYWTSQVEALLDHVEELEAENARLKQLDLFGAADGRLAGGTR